MQSPNKAMPVGLVVLSCVLTCCATSPLVGWHARRQSVLIVAGILELDVQSACVGTNGEGGRWYFALSSPLTDPEIDAFKLRLGTRESLLACNEPLRGIGNPTLEDPPPWFNWRAADDEVLDRCTYATPYGITGVTVLTTHRVLVAHRDHDDAAVGWPSDDVVRFYGHFCE